MALALGALPWLGALLLAVLVLVVMCYWPLRLDVSARARGEADGSWVVAGGAALGGLSLTLVWARGVKPELSLLLLGQKLAWKPQWSRKLGRPVPERVKAASRRAWRRVDSVQLLLKLLSERRHLRVRYLVLDLAYGFRDPLLTGRLVGALAVLSGVLPPPFEIRQRPRWDFEDGWDVALDGRAFVKPWLVLLDMAAYVVRQMLARAAKSDAPLPAAS